jgi:hypothetical protein
MVSSYLNALGFQRIAAEASVDRLKNGIADPAFIHPAATFY